MKRRDFLLILIALGVLAACGVPTVAANPANPRLGMDGLCFDRSKYAPGC